MLRVVTMDRLATLGNQTPASVKKDNKNISTLILSKGSMVKIILHRVFLRVENTVATSDQFSLQKKDTGERHRVLV